MNQEQAASLLRRYLNDECTADEKQLVQQWYLQLVETGEWHWDDTLRQELGKMMEQRLLKKIKTTATAKETPINSMHSFSSNRSTFWLVAASILFIIVAGGGAYVFLNNKKTGQSGLISQPSENHDLSPGGNKAVLTLSDGSTVVLDSLHSGRIAKQGDVEVLKSTEGTVIYTGSNERATASQYNVISTPRGGEYQVVLSDGTKVWLNAASSLRFPVHFTKSTREVELDGEGYFEVAHDAARPFHVRFNQYVDHIVLEEKLDVEVLGTHFNINSYNDEDQNKTTLLEGVVKVHKDSNTSLLKPGEQAVVNGSSMYISKNVDIQQVIAWKNNWFEFDNTDVRTVMRQISRWYDVDIVYEAKPTGEKLGGRISKNLPLSNVLRLLANNGVNSRLQGKVLTVTK
jgi:transmembrane sensor